MFKNIAPAICMFVLSITFSFVSAKADDITDRTFIVTVDEETNLELSKNYNCAPPKELAMFKSADGPHECKIVLLGLSAGMTVKESTESFISIPLAFGEDLSMAESIEEAVNMIKNRKNLRPATPNETLMLGITYPELNTQYIIAPGETVSQDGQMIAVHIYYNCIGTTHTDGKLKDYILLAFVILE